MIPASPPSCIAKYIAKYSFAEIGVRIRCVMPAEAGIQLIFLNSGLKHAGMTRCDNGHFIVLG
jgi:hypothetical protein